MLAWFFSLAVCALAGSSVEIVNVGTSYTTVWAVRQGDAVVLIDAHNPGKQDAIARRLSRAGLDPDNVSALILTHGHPDHAGSAAALADVLDVPVIAGALDAPYLAAGTAPLHPTGSRGSLVAPLVRKRFPPVSIDVPVTGTLNLAPYGIEGRAQVVGGHTPGSLVVSLDDGSVFIGDLIRSRLFRHHRPTLHFFHDDLPVAHAQLGQIADSASTLYPAHGGSLDADLVARWLADRGARAQRTVARSRARPPM